MKANRIVLAVMVFMLGSVSARAAALTWKVPAGNWSVSANWTNNVAPTGGTDTVTFTNILPGVVSTNNIAALSITSVTIKDGTNTLDLAGNSLTCKTFAVNGFGVGTNGWLTLTNGGLLVVTNSLLVGSDPPALPALQLGYVDAVMKLAPDTALQVGLSTTKRAVLRVSANTGSTDRKSSASLIAGKVFNAYLTDLYVAYREGSFNSLSTYGLLDLSAVTNKGVLDVAGNVLIGIDYAAGQVIVPDSIDVRIGSAQARGGQVRVAYGNSQGYDSSLTLGKGRFDAYVTDVILAEGYSVGSLIATNVSGGVLDISKSLVIGKVGNAPVAAGGNMFLGDGVDVKIGDPSSRAATFAVGINATQQQTSKFEMGNGRFEATVTNFWVGYGNVNGRQRIFQFNAANVSTGILDVSESFSVGEYANAAGGSTTVTLGDQFVTTIGSSAHRLAVTVGGVSSYVTRLKAGGVFNAYLTALTVGTSYAINSQTDSLLDLSSVTNGTLDVSGTVLIGDSETTAGNKTAIGELRLPAIPVSAGNLIVGSTNIGGKGTLIMTGTVFAVTNSVLVDGSSVANKGRINVTVAGTSAGLDLDAAATLSVTQGVIAITFKDPAKPAPVYWGLRWKGDHAAALTTLRTASKLTWDATAMTDPKLRASVAIFVQDNVTYVGARQSGGTLILIR